MSGDVRVKETAEPRRGRVKKQLPAAEYRSLRRDLRSLMAQSVGFNGRFEARNALVRLLVEQRVSWEEFERLSVELGLDKR